MTNQLPLMIFAAGFGTRMGELTRTTPKPLLTVAGRTLLDRSLDLAEEAGHSQIVVNTHYHGDQIVRHLSGRGVQISQEAPEILDTGGGLKRALPLLGPGPVATLNPDVIWRGPNPLSVLGNLWQADEMDALLLCVPLERTSGRVGDGDFDIGPDGRIRRPGGLVYGGAQIINPALVASEPARNFSLNLIWNRLIAVNRLRLAVYPGHWCDVGRPEGIAIAEEMIGQNV